MKILLTLTMAAAISTGFLGCKSNSKATSAAEKSIPERIGHDARSVGEQAFGAVDVGVKAVGKAGEAVINAFSSDKDSEEDE